MINAATTPHEELATFIREQLVSGFRSYDDLRESVLFRVEDDTDIPADEAIALLESMWDQRLAEQQTWTDTGDFGRLERLFAQLESGGILGRMCFTCCNNCAFYEIDYERTPSDDANDPYPYREWAFVYFHDQDAAGLGEPDPILFLAYSAWTLHPQLPNDLITAASRGDEAARGEAVAQSEVLLGHQIVAAAANCGLTPEWSGSRHERIALRIRDWRKPLAPRPSETA